MPNLATAVDCTWTNAMTMDEAELRRADTAMFLGDGSNNGVRGGIIRHGDTSLAVTVNGSDQVTVQPGAFVIPAATGLGAYRGSIQTAIGPGAGTALTARNGTNPRIDLIVIQIVSGQGQLKTIDGTASSSPVAPALPAQHIELARVTVPQVGGSAVTVDSSWRQYTAALGGTFFVETVARLPMSGNQKGQRAVALDTGATYEWNGTGWNAPGFWQTWTPSFIGGVTIGNGVFTGRYTLMGKTCHFWARFILGTTSAQTGVAIGTLPFNALANTTAYSILQGHIVDIGTADYEMHARQTQVNGISIYTQAANGLYSGTYPFTMGNGDYIEWRGTYEIA